jgi:AraC-like DNA-binding protein
MKTLPVHLDVFALVMILGVAQGVFLGAFFLSGERSRDVANRCFGWFILGLTAIMGEILLCYTNYMFGTLWLIDVAEPFNFWIGPLLFLFVFTRLNGQLPRHWNWHLLPGGLWLLYSATWQFQSIAFKYNAYINAYHPELTQLPITLYIPSDPLHLRDFDTELMLLSCLIYAGLSLWVLRQAYRQTGEPFFKAGPLAHLRNLILFNAAVPILLVAVKLSFYEDLGDYLLACWITTAIYAASLWVMSSSAFFRPMLSAQPLPTDDLPSELSDELPARKKYEKSSLSEEVEEAVLQKLARLMETDKIYLDNTLSLPKLAARLQTSPHHLSQLLNNRLGQTFFDWLARQRVLEAQRLLRQPTTAGLKIDDLAERVGYNSPSAFHTAFKRLTGQTPAQFRDSAGSVSVSRTPSR